MDNQGKQTELVKREIVNCIMDRKLKVGDRIPTQAELRKKLGVGNAVIGRAVQALTEDGVLESRGHGGVVICSPFLEGYAGRTIGIICHRDTQFVVMAAIMQSLGIALNQRACQPHLFLKNKAELKDSFNIEEFSGAVRAVTRHQIDGLISTVLLDQASLDFCSENNVPLCYIAVSNPNTSSVNYSIDFQSMMKYVAGKGYHKPMLIHSGHPVTQKIRQDFLANAKDFDFGGKDPLFYCRFLREDASASWLLEDTHKKVKSLIHEFSSMDRDLRPDVLLVPTDDVIATWIALGWKDAPEIVHLEIAELGYSWQLRERGPYFWYSAAEIAKRAVQLLLDLICGNVKAPAQILIPLELRNTEKKEVCINK